MPLRETWARAQAIEAHGGHMGTHPSMANMGPRVGPGPRGRTNTFVINIVHRTMKEIKTETFTKEPIVYEHELPTGMKFASLTVDHPLKREWCSNTLVISHPDCTCYPCVQCISNANPVSAYDDQQFCTSAHTCTAHSCTVSNNTNTRQLHRFVVCFLKGDIWI